MADKVLVLNSGSSSLKYKLFSSLGAGGKKLLAVASGLVERIGESQTHMVTKIATEGKPPEKVEVSQPMPDHGVALTAVLDLLRSRFSASIADDVKVVGHRVVHGGSLGKPEIVTEKVIKTIERAASLAPLHNPPNLTGIHAATGIFHCPQVAVFDTAFHMTMPPPAYTYALPRALCEEHAIRRYGFHGTSYKYVSARAAQMLGRPISDVNLIVCHLGAGSSICCIQNGVSIDTSMGLTPLEGLVMASRSGDIDPAIVMYLHNNAGMSNADIDTLLNKKSGLLGICGNKDFRSILETIKEKPGSEEARRSELAFNVFVHRVRKYLGSYMVQLGGRVDAIVFTAGIGENAAAVRQAIVHGLEPLGVSLDTCTNLKTVGEAGVISDAASKIKVMVVPTDEELSIAEQSLETIG
ncbi:unnamed protein product [Pedinophyceae sp. YPF-701]|nr:unnamed protein product [Pedinophyceae sp. YPF-701]